MDPIRAVRDAIARGRRAALVSVREVHGAAPSRPGQSLAVLEDGAVEGTLGCDGFDRSGAADALRALRDGRASRANYPWDESSDVVVEIRPFAPGDAVPDPGARPELVVVGRGPVAAALVRMGGVLGFRVRAVSGPGREPAPELAGADETAMAPEAADVAGVAVGPDSFVVICGHDAEFSQPVLRMLLASAAPYLGMMGSHRHTGQLIEQLRAAGFGAAALARVHSPMGLDIGARTPEEIALSALAQIVSLRGGGTGRALG